MKKFMCLVAVLVFSASSFGIIDTIEIKEVNGYQASYDHTTQTITWTGGASATLYKDNGSFVPIDSVNVTATFTQLTDASSGGWANGTFSVVNWRVDLLHQGSGNYAGFIAGTQLASNVFEEIEGVENTGPFGGARIQQNELFGAGIVQVTSYDFSNWGATWADPTNSSAGMSSHAVLGQPADPDQFGSYLTDDYATSETTLFLYADETAIPEPATMGLLGLGALLLRRRKA